MKHTEILGRAIEKAKKNGLQGLWGNNMESWYIGVDNNSPGLTINLCGAEFMLNIQSNTLIFSHDFAKAFWGDELIPTDTGMCPKYLHELQQMVLEENPIKYLEQFL